jgi:polyhydroxyalkanoate synthesis regulator phasin
MSSDESLTPQPEFTESSDQAFDRVNNDSPTASISAHIEAKPETKPSSPAFQETIAVSFTEITESEIKLDLPPTDVTKQAPVLVDFPVEVSVVPAVVGNNQADGVEVTGLNSDLEQLKLKKAAIEQEIKEIHAEKARLIAQQSQSIQEAIAKLVQEGLASFEQRKQSLETTIEQLERKRDRLRAEQRSTFAGVSQDLAIRVQGFKDYLVGSLQDLASAAEQLDLVPESPKNWNSTPEVSAPTPAKARDSVQFSPSKFEEQNRRIQELLDQYRSRPDYYGPPWQLRRTFEPIHAERVRKWFQAQGGRGAIRGLGSRLQNILVASAVISILHKLYGDRVRTLILANSPERLGEWRRGLQDCLGVSRADFGPERGLVLFESPEAMVQKAERLQEDGLLPFILIDESEEEISLTLLQFSLWLAFAPDPQQSSNYSY